MKYANDMQSHKAKHFNSRIYIAQKPNITCNIEHEAKHFYSNISNTLQIWKIIKSIMIVQSKHCKAQNMYSTKNTAKKRKHQKAANSHKWNISDSWAPYPCVSLVCVSLYLLRNVFTKQNSFLHCKSLLDTNKKLKNSTHAHIKSSYKCKFSTARKQDIKKQQNIYNMRK